MDKPPIAPIIMPYTGTSVRAVRLRAVMKKENKSNLTLTVPLALQARPA